MFIENQIEKQFFGLITGSVILKMSIWIQIQILGVKDKRRKITPKKLQQLIKKILV